MSNRRAPTLVCQPSTSSGCGASEEETAAEESFVYDISLKLQVDVPNSHFDQSDIMAAVSAILTGHLFTIHSDWSFLATPTLRILDEALAVSDAPWETREDRRILQNTIHIMGHLVNIRDKPPKTRTTCDQVTYNGCVNQTKIMLDYNLKFLFMPATIAAEKIYESHGWLRDQTSQTDDARSLKLLDILKRHQDDATFNHELAWSEMFAAGRQPEGKKSRPSGKRKHQNAA